MDNIPGWYGAQICASSLEHGRWRLVGTTHSDGATQISNDDTYCSMWLDIKDVAEIICHGWLR